MTAFEDSVARLTYVSETRIAGCEETRRRALWSILDVARPRNAALGITGALFCSDRAFLQVLEGPWDRIERLMGSIGADPRHDNLIWVDRQLGVTRAFECWAMAMISPGGAVEAMLTPLSWTPPFDVSGYQGEALTAAALAAAVQCAPPDRLHRTA